MVYNLDPISITLYSEEELYQIIQTLSTNVDIEAGETSIELAEKIVCLSNVQSVIVELISRYELTHEKLKVEAEGKQAQATKKHREEWELEHPGDNKYPASKYFEDLGKNDNLELLTKVSTAKSMLTKFKGFRNNYETKINALKKLLEAMRAVEY